MLFLDNNSSSASSGLIVAQGRSGNQKLSGQPKSARSLSKKSMPFAPSQLNDSYGSCSSQG